MNLPRRFLSHGIIVLVALAAGLWLRNLVPGPVATEVSASSLRESSPARVSNSSAPRPLNEWDAGEISKTAAALREAHNSPNPLRSQSQLLQGLFSSTRAAEDFTKLSGLLAGMPPGPEKEAAIRDAYRQWAGTNPDAAIDQMMQLGSAEQRSALHGILSELAKSDPQKAIAILDKQSGRMRSEGAEVLMQEMARYDAEGAFRQAVGASENSIEKAGLMGAVRGWLAQNPDAALAALSKVEGDPGLMPRALFEFAEMDPRSALTKAMEEISKPEAPAYYAGMTAEIMSRWAGQDPSAALQRAMEQPAGTMRNKMLEAVAISGQHTGMLLEAVTDNDDRNVFLGGLIHRNLSSGSEVAVPTEAAELVMRYATNESRPEHLKQLGCGWAKLDAPAAATWLSSLPPGADRDDAVTGFANAIAGSDPGYAMDWNASISDIPVRDRQLNMLFPQWFEKDSRAARAWLEATEQLSKETKEAWLLRFPAP